MNEKTKQLFLSLVYTFQMQAMMQLGKITNPVTNKTETELEGAQVTIDMLEMILEKTKNNLEDDEKKFLEQVLSDLRLNYVDTKEKSGNVKSKDTVQKDNSHSGQIKEDEQSVPPQE